MDIWLTLHLVPMPPRTHSSRPCRSACERTPMTGSPTASWGWRTCRSRETGDPYYQKTDEALDKALSFQPEDYASISAKGAGSGPA